MHYLNSTQLAKTKQQKPLFAAQGVRVSLGALHPFGCNTSLTLAVCFSAGVEPKACDRPSTPLNPAACPVCGSAADSEAHKPAELCWASNALARLRSRFCGSCEHVIQPNWASRRDAGSRPNLARAIQALSADGLCGVPHTSLHGARSWRPGQGFPLCSKLVRNPREGVRFSR